MSEIRRYLAEIGARGGRKSRRALAPETARAMVRVREARRAYRRFRTTCFWSYSPDLVITAADVAWVAEQLMRHGDREAYLVGDRLRSDRAHLEAAGDATRVDWAHDSAWRFMPLVPDTLGGWLLHPVDLALNKLLALAGRDEPRDFFDILYVHRTILPLGGLVWAAAGKDPGLSPLSLLELLRRRGHGRPEEYARPQLAEPFDFEAARVVWRLALEEAERFVRERPATELGCLYFDARGERFTLPSVDATLVAQGIVVHYGTPGGVFPKLTEIAVSDSAVDGDADRRTR